MRRFLFLLLVITGLSLSAVQAQAVLIARLLVNGGMAAANANRMKGREQESDEYALTSSYKGLPLLQKRTPAKKLSGKKGVPITLVEGLLQECYTTMTTDSLATICPPKQQESLLLAQQQLEVAQPGWNQYAYRQERDFYLEEDKRRQQAARKRQQHHAQVKALRLKARQDSVARTRAGY